MATFKMIDNYIIECGYNLFCGDYKYYIDKTTWRVVWCWTAKTGYTKLDRPILNK